MVQGYSATRIWQDEGERLGDPWNVNNVRDMLQRAFGRRPSTRALKMTGCCFHPSLVG